jgi:3-deoxy-manno-octulosonate cytidylyltransferase (CMP-KDO synthetase)
LAIVAIIPARFGATRLPGKPLSDIHGRPMIQHVYERARRARSVERVLVATEDQRIADAVRGFGGEAVMTSARHASGTDRLAEAAAGLADSDIVVNVQGDEPMLDPAGIDAVVSAFDANDVLMSTVSLPLRDVADMTSVNVVKVVTDAAGDALYFSRSPIPCVRDAPGPGGSAAAAVAQGLARRHVGLYGYRRHALSRFAGWPPAPLEVAEGLEQLRAMFNGMAIRVVAMEGEGGVAVDTQDDLDKVRRLLAGDNKA